MRLICPNCGAQYEVDAGVIPETGRDVQCSNCGNTWFERHARQEAETEQQRPAAAPQSSGHAPAPHGGDDGNVGAQGDDASEVPDQTPDQAPSQPETEAAPAASADSPPDRQPDTAEAPEGAEDAGGDQPDQTGDPDQAGKPDQTSKPDQPAPRQQKGLDDGVADILRQEAERESRERASESVGLETQPDLGLADGPKGPTPSAPATDATVGADAPEHAEANRRNLLPDIEEINSTLAAQGGRGDDDAAREQEIRRRSGFRRGFTYAILVFAIMALVYVFAARIAQAIPQTGPALAAYVDWINGLRSSVDAMMLRAVDKLTGLLAQLSGEK